MTTDIFVNGHKHSVAWTTISYAEAVALAGVKTGEAAPDLYTVVVHYPKINPRSMVHADYNRTLTRDESAPIVSGMHIGVADTSRA
jgi:hypothetical protein